MSSRISERGIPALSFAASKAIFLFLLFESKLGWPVPVFDITGHALSV
jgi:hypothetical protein